MKKFFLLFLIVLSGFVSKATHIVQTELTYEYLGSDQYEFTLTLIANCGLGSFPPPDNVVLSYCSPSGCDLIKY